MSQSAPEVIYESEKMQPKEKKTAIAVAAVFSTRMLGLFMIFPVFALFAQEEFKGITGFQIGLAMGIYGLTQALLQIPYGMLSDKYGRKPLILTGMFVFMIGSMICAMADSINMMIIGRAIQGMGAVAAVLMATVADNVSERFRLRAMSIVGMTIGFSFTVSLLLGPILGSMFGVRGIFWAIAGLAILGMILVVFMIPPIEKQIFQREAEADPAQFKDVLTHPQLLRLDYGVFSLHATLTAMFVVIPFLIRDTAGLNATNEWQLYLPVMLLSFVLMVPFIILAESKGKMKEIFVGSIIVISLMQFGFGLFGQGFWPLFILLMVFFTAFNLLEASLPSLIVKISPADKKGTASGIYSSSQFMGAAIGGAIGGFLYQHYSFQGVFYFTGGMTLIWATIAWSMERPKNLSIASLPLTQSYTDEHLNRLQQDLLAYEGIEEVVILKQDQRVYFKIDRKQVSESHLINYLQKGLATE